MKLLDTSPISVSAQFFYKKGTLQFLQDAHREVFAALIKSLIGPLYNPATVYVMSGVINSATAPIYNISSGAIFFNGEVFDFDTTAFTSSGSDVGVFSIVQTQYTINADPVTFTDLTLRNVHNIRKMQLASGVSGSGLANFAQLFRLSFQIPAQLNLTAPTTPPYDDNVLQLIGAYPDLIAYVPAPLSNAHQILEAGSLNLGDIPGGGGADYTVTLGSTVASSDYYVVGTLVSNGGDESANCTCVWVPRGRTTTQFVIHVRELGGGFAQNIAFEYMIFAK